MIGVENLLQAKIFHIALEDSGICTFSDGGYHSLQTNTNCIIYVKNALIHLKNGMVIQINKYEVIKCLG